MASFQFLFEYKNELNFNSLLPISKTHCLNQLCVLLSLANIAQEFLCCIGSLWSIRIHHIMPTKSIKNYSILYK